jgi:hypothetical protein
MAPTYELGTGFAREFAKLSREQSREYRRKSRNVDADSGNPFLLAVMPVTGFAMTGMDTRHRFRLEKRDGHG